MSVKLYNRILQFLLLFLVVDRKVQGGIKSSTELSGAIYFIRAHDPLSFGRVHLSGEGSGRLPAQVSVLAQVDVSRG